MPGRHMGRKSMASRWVIYTPSFKQEILGGGR
jgi:hypothetical protein